MIRFDLDDDVEDDDLDEDDLDEDAENPDDDDEDEEDDADDADVETWQVGVRSIPLKGGLRLTSSLELPRLARISQLG